MNAKLVLDVLRDQANVIDALSAIVREECPMRSALKTDLVELSRNAKETYEALRKQVVDDFDTDEFVDSVVYAIEVGCESVWRNRLADLLDPEYDPEGKDETANHDTSRLVKMLRYVGKKS